MDFMMKNVNLEMRFVQNDFFTQQGLANNDPKNNYNIAFT